MESAFSSCSDDKKKGGERERENESQNKKQDMYATQTQKYKTRQDKTRQDTKYST
jgi:hypothetical protein